MLSGNTFDLDISRSSQIIDNRAVTAVTINQQLPAPLLRWREGDHITLRVTNHLDEDSSIHWHGILLDSRMDGVPGLSFPGIKPGETFTYQFPLKQAGSYWYHSHSGMQEQLGHYGPIIIEPRADPVNYDREYIILLSDWTFEEPHKIFANLKTESHIYNQQPLTLVDFFAEASQHGFQQTLSERMMWSAMRMDPTDISDTSAITYTYLINGHSPSENWTGLFRPGERLRLRFINASAMSIFNIRIPGLPMTIVQADGNNVKPVTIDEFQIGTAETYDTIVHMNGEQDAYTIMCETNGRSGYARATLATKDRLTAAVPPLRQRPTLTMKDMGMANHNHDGKHNMPSTHHQQHPQRNSPNVANHAVNPTNRLAERPLGLQHVPHRVLVYSDLISLEKNPDLRSPERAIEIHLTSNMERYIWSFDGQKFSEVKTSIIFHHGERLRLTMVNDTMMPHPIHLHGMFFDVVTDEHHYKPRKHTIVIKPGEKLSVDITADALGDWAFHCHLLYHMLAGMMRVISVRAII